MIECQIKDLFIQKDNCIYIPYALHFQVTCLQILDSRRSHLSFLSLNTNIIRLNLW